MLGYAGHNTGGQETAARLDFLRKVFDVSGSVPASLLAGCVNSLLGVDGQDDTFQFIRNCTTWWHDDNKELTRQLRNLLRGMHHGSLSMFLKVQREQAKHLNMIIIQHTKEEDCTHYQISHEGLCKLDCVMLGMTYQVRMP